MDVSAIDDPDLMTDKSEEYISDLEDEIDRLKAEIKLLKKKAMAKQHETRDTSCCEAYSKELLINFHKLLDEVIPF